MIALSRVDERLIHGQVAFAWTFQYKADAIVVVDAPSANDKMSKSLLEMACPRTMKCFVLDEEKSIALLKKYPNKKFFLVAKHPKTFLTLIENGIEMKSVNIGGIYYKEGRQQVTNTVFLDDETKEVLHKIHDKGIYLDGRTTPSDAELDLAKKI